MAVPEGWRREASGNAVGLVSPGGQAEVRVYAVKGGPPKDFADQAARALAYQHPGARIGGPRSVAFGALPATSVRARYADGQETAIVLARKRYAYLILRRTDRTAGQADRELSAAIISSLRFG